MPKCYIIRVVLFFNLSTIKEIWKVPEDSITENLVLKLKNYMCPDCQVTLASVRICFPHSAEQSPEDQAFDDLGKIGAYSMLRTVPMPDKT